MISMKCIQVSDPKCAFHLHGNDATFIIFEDKLGVATLNLILQYHGSHCYGVKVPKSGGLV